MLINSSITLYHYVEDEERYIKIFFKKASLYHAIKSAPAENGFRYDNIFKIRIPTSDYIPIHVGDFVFIGECDADTPEKTKCHRVMAYADNRRGNLQHWRIECK